MFLLKENVSIEQIETMLTELIYEIDRQAGTNIFDSLYNESHCDEDEVEMRMALLSRIVIKSLGK